jgi:predicted RNA-binding protein with PIN domain
LIDGYNLLHDLQNQKDKKRRLSRESLLACVASFAASRNTPVHFVMDGVGSPQELESFNTRLFTACYSQKVSADTYIEKYLYDKKGRAAIIVVTHDRAISNMARGAGARVMSPTEFAELLQNTEKDRSDILFQQKVKSHGFNRPFDGKL